MATTKSRHNVSDDMQTLIDKLIQVSESTEDTTEQQKEALESFYDTFKRTTSKEDKIRNAALNEIKYIHANVKDIKQAFGNQADRFEELIDEAHAQTKLTGSMFGLIIHDIKNIFEKNSPFKQLLDRFFAHSNPLIAAMFGTFKSIITYYKDLKARAKKIKERQNFVEIGEGVKDMASNLQKQNDILKKAENEANERKQREISIQHSLKKQAKELENLDKKFNVANAHLGLIEKIEEAIFDTGKEKFDKLLKVVNDAYNLESLKLTSMAINLENIRLSATTISDSLEDIENAIEKVLKDGISSSDSKPKFIVLNSSENDMSYEDKILQPILGELKEHTRLLTTIKTNNTNFASEYLRPIKDASEGLFHYIHSIGTALAKKQDEAKLAKNDDDPKTDKKFIKSKDYQDTHSELLKNVDTKIEDIIEIQKQSLRVQEDIFDLLDKKDNVPKSKSLGPSKSKSMFGWLGDLLSGAFSLEGLLEGLLGAKAFKWLKAIVTKKFSIKLPTFDITKFTEILSKFNPIPKLIEGFEFFSKGIGKILKPLMKMGSVLKIFVKGIPILGTIFTVIEGLIDGITAAFNADKILDKQNVDWYDRISAAIGGVIGGVVGGIVDTIQHIFASISNNMFGTNFEFSNYQEEWTKSIAKFVDGLRDNTKTPEIPQNENDQKETTKLNLSDNAKPAINKPKRLEQIEDNFNKIDKLKSTQPSSDRTSGSNVKIDQSRQVNNNTVVSGPISARTQDSSFKTQLPTPYHRWS